MHDAVRDERILEHLGLYRLSFRALLERLFFDGRAAACANVIDRLRHEGRIRAVPTKAGALKYYQLTAAEAGRRGIPQRALPLGSRALPEAIAVLWFAKVLGVERHRLEQGELGELFPTGAPHGPHVLERGDPPRIFRVYVPGPRTKMATVIAAVDEITRHARMTDALSSWVANRLYALAVLLPTLERESKFRRALEKTRAGEGAYIVSARTPDPHSIARALHGLRNDG